MHSQEMRKIQNYISAWNTRVHEPLVLMLIASLNTFSKHIVFRSSCELSTFFDKRNFNKHKVIYGK